MFRVFPHRVSAAALLEVLMDGVVGFAAVLAAAVTLQSEPGQTLLQALGNGPTLLAATAFAVVMALLQSFLGLYRHANIALSAVVWRMAVAVVVGGYVSYLTLKQITLEGHPSVLVGTAMVYLLVGLVLVKGGAQVLRHSLGARRVLVIGTGPDAAQVAGGLDRLGSRDRRIVGFYPTSHAMELAVDAPRVLDGAVPLQRLVREQRIDEIIVAVREQRGGVMPMDQLLAVRSAGVPVMDLAGFFERTHAEVPLDSLKASWLVYGDGFVQGPARRAAKRVFDIVSSGLLLLLASPVMLVAALVIKLDSRGPVFYKQERVGLNGSIFWCLKFRSMRTDAERDGVARWATKNDDRVTRVGRFIRKTRIDELPQLISVLRGEMSMVGPRPERPSFVAQLREQIPYYDLRHTIKPGLTGWAQVRYAYGASLEDARRKHQFDLYYLKNNSLLLDFLVLIETVAVVLFREGAQ